jgi:hypothetical protein
MRPTLASRRAGADRQFLPERYISRRPNPSEAAGFRIYPAKVLDGSLLKSS